MGPIVVIDLVISLKEMATDYKARGMQAEASVALAELSLVEAELDARGV